MKSSPNQACAIIQFLKGLDPHLNLPRGVTIMNPFLDKNCFQLVEKFYEKFYSDSEPRIMVFGINPGRFGGGITGIPFTDPIKLQEHCGIPNEYKKIRELSADFVYEFINALGGPQSFYKKFFISAVCPLGFVKDGKNMNYYDANPLYQSVEPFIIDSIRNQMQLIKCYPACICLGEGANYKYLLSLNATHHFFRQIVPLPHPRWIMQYRKKSVLQYVELYRSQMEELVGEYF